MGANRDRRGQRPAGRGQSLLRVDEVARRLDVSMRSTRRLIALQQLPTVRIGRAVRVSAAALDTFCAKGGTARG
jgi:excisionase family DNA binding protein